MRVTPVTELKAGRELDALVAEKPCRKCGSLRMNRAESGRRWCLDCRKRRYQRNGQPKGFAAYRRNWHLKQRYGITADRFNEIAVEQRGVCAICKQPPSSKQKGDTLHVDHDHETNAVRG